LSESEGKALLAAGGVPVPRGVVARTVEEALEAVRAVGFPVVLKIVSRSIAHKSDVGGVRIGLTTGEAVRSAWHEILAQVRAARVDALIEGLLVEAMAPPGGAESIVAVHRDPVFGHVMSFGPGGVLAELLGGTSRRLLPVTESQALGMIAETPFARLIAGYRNQPARDLGALARLMAQLSSIVAGDPDRIEELEINPVWIGREGEGVLALDALVVVRD
jgi:acetate---CoA ligase (ADP-forming)